MSRLVSATGKEKKRDVGSVSKTGLNFKKKKIIIRLPAALTESLFPPISSFFFLSKTVKILAPISILCIFYFYFSFLFIVVFTV